MSSTGTRPSGDHVDQAVVVEAGMEVDVAAEVGHAQGVAVLPDAVDDLAGDLHACSPFGPFGSAEPQRIEHADDVGAHAVDVADDAADAGRRALDGQDLRRVVVALVRDHDAPALAVDLAEVHDAGVLARAQDHVGAAVGGQVLLQDVGGCSCRSSARSTSCRRG